MVKINFIIFFLFFGILFSQAQRITARSDSIFFSGIVMDAKTMLPLEDVVVHWKNRISVSESSGRFFIKTGRGDSVRFTHVGYRPYTVMVPDSLSDPEYMMGIFMALDTVGLPEVLILKRFRNISRQNLIHARNNMSGVLKQAYAPVGSMDAEMNQKMMIEDFARGIEMKGHVDVRAGVGTQSLEAFRNLRLQKKLQDEKVWLNTGEVDLLKKLYNLEKRKNRVN